jgi:BT1 family
VRGNSHASIYIFYLTRTDLPCFSMVPWYFSATTYTAVIYQVAAMMDFMPAVVLTSASCPKGMEATVYALLAGFQNFGSNVAREIGVGLLNYLQIQTNEPCNFERFPFAVVLAHIIVPSFCIPLIFVLIPNKLMTEKLLDEDEMVLGAESELGAAALEDTDDEDDEEDTDKETLFERRELFPRQSAAVDVELESIYEESEDQSSFSNSYRAGESFPTIVSPAFPPNDDRRSESER